MREFKMDDLGKRSALALGVILAGLLVTMIFAQVAFAANWQGTQGPIVDPQGDVGQYTSIALDSSKQPSISYYDASNHALKYAYKDSSGFWQPGTVDSGNDLGQYSSLALDCSGNPHIAYYDATNGDLKYAYKDATGWHTEIADPENNTGQYASLALDASGNPNICYYDATNADLKFAYRDGTGAWHVENADSPGDVGKYCSMTIDSTGKPHASYYDAGTGDLKYAYRDAGGWHTETVENTGDLGQYTSIDVDTSNRPHISYYDVTNGDLKYAYKPPAGAWQLKSVETAGNVGQYSSLAVDISGNPRVSYYDATNHALKCAYRDANNQWVIEVVDTTGDKGKYSAIVVDGLGKPHISYYDANPAGTGTGNGDLKYAYKDAPVVTATDPMASVNGISRDKNVTVTFNENIQQSANFATIVLKDSKNNVLTSAITINGKTLTIDPANNFGYNSSYTVIIPAGAIEDDAHNALAMNYTFSFTTQGDVPPTITSSDPSANVTGVDASESIYIFFSEDIQAGDNAFYNGITLKTATGTAVACSVSISNGVSNGSYKNMLIIDPANNLQYSTAYSVNIPAKAVKDMTGNPLMAGYVFNFNTDDNAPPVVASTNPANGLTNVAVSKTITVTFNEYIQEASAFSNIVLKDSNGSAVSAAMSVSGSTLTIDPAPYLGYSKTYTVTIPASAVKDGAGRLLAAAYSFSFTVQASTTLNSPINLKATPSSSTITLTWDKVNGATSYNIYIRQGLGSYERINTGYITNNTYIDGSAKLAFSYTYYVVAVGSDGAESGRSNEVQTSLGIVAGTVIYNDVVANAWYRTYVEQLVDKKAISGYPTGEFRPNVAITRGEFTKVLCLAMGWQLVNPAKRSFNDVAPSSWVYQYAQTAVAHGVMGGYQDGTFRPNDLITRAEIAKVIAFTLDLPIQDTDNGGFFDTHTSWARTYISTCVRAKIISGYSNGSFQPNEIATRAEACKMIVGMMNYKK